MTINVGRAHHLLRQNVLFASLTEPQFQKLLHISSEVNLNPGEYLVREDEIATNFFILMDGQAEITKSSKAEQKNHVLAQLKVGESVGEVALFDKAPRSASVQAVTAACFLSFSFEEFERLAEEEPSFRKIFSLIAKNLSTRIRHSNEVIIQALEKQVEEYKLRTTMGGFMLVMIVSLCIFTFVLGWIKDISASASTSAIITIPLTILFVMLFIFIARYLKMPLHAFGLTTKNWQRSIIESVGFTLIIFLLVIIIKSILIHTVLIYADQPIFQPNAGVHVSTMSQASINTVWWISVIIYWFIVSPMQELIARGGLQGPLEIFLTGDHKTLKAILVSNLMFSTMHLFLSFNIAILVSVSGLYFGWLYSRHRNLIGVTIAHALLGTWAFYFVGFT